MRKRVTAGVVGTLTALLTGGAILIATSTATAQFGVWHQRPVRASGAGALTTSTVTNVIPTVNDQFQVNAGGWCVGGGAPCDGNAAAGDFGTIDASIPSGFSNGGFGNYAPGTKALDTNPSHPQMALISGTTQANQGLGCQTPGVEGCTGPYYVPPTAESVFPSNGFTVTDDIYLDPSAAVGTAAEIDEDVAISTNTGSYGQDMIFAVCNQGGGTGYSVSYGHNSPGNCGGSPVITTAGWYRFVWLFTSVGGKAYLTQRVIAETGLATVADSGPQPVNISGGTSAQSISDLGGVDYVWFPTLQVSGMPMANFAIQQGQHQSGHTA